MEDFAELLAEDRRAWEEDFWNHYNEVYDMEDDEE